MTIGSRPVAGLLGGLALALSACGGHRDAARAPAGDGSPATSPGSVGSPKAASGPAPTLADGPDVCFRAVARRLGATTKVSEITSFFSVGREIDATSTRSRGEMTTCTVTYQNPADPRKLLTTSLDTAGGAFAPTRPVEITVMGGDEAKFRLDDYLIPLSRVDAAALAATMKAQEPGLGRAYGRYAWSGIRLSAPDAFSATHTLRLDVTGRLATNDIKKDGYASVTTDAGRSRRII